MSNEASGAAARARPNAVALTDGDITVRPAAGRLPPSEGRVEVFGASLPGLNRQSGYLFQSDSLFPWKTALENVAIGLETAGTPQSEARSRAQEWLTRVGLGSFGPRYP